MKKWLIVLSVSAVFASMLSSLSPAKATSFQVRLNNYSSVISGDFDSLGNQYFAEGNGITTIRKIDTDGVLSTFVNYDIPGGREWVIDLDVAPDGSIYTYGRLFGRTGNSEEPYVAKFTADGSFAWQRYWSGTYAIANDLISVLPDSSVVASYRTTAGVDAVKRIDSLGLDVWTTELSQSTGYKSVATDSSGNSFLAYEGDVGNTNQIIVAKLDGTGAILWQTAVSHDAVQALEFNNTEDFVQLLATDSGCGYVISLNSAGQIETDTLVTCRTQWSWELFVDSSGSWYVAADGGGSSVGISKWTDDVLVTSITSNTGNSRFDVDNLYVNQSGDISYSIYQGCNAQTRPQDCGYWVIQVGQPVAPRIISSTSTYARSTSVTVSGVMDSSDLSTDLVLDLSRSSNMSSPQTFTVVSGINSSSYAFTKNLESLELGGTYYYQLRATNSVGTATSVMQTFSLPNTPSQPTLGSPTRTLDSFGIQLNWEKPSANGSALESNLVEYKIGSSGSWTGSTSVPISVSSTQTATLTLSNSNAGAVAYFRLQTGNAAGWSTWSDSVSIQLPSAPSSPSNVVAAQSGSDINISWDRPTNWQNADTITYSFEATSNGLTWTSVNMASFPTSTSSVFDAGMIGSSYRFRVTATNFLGSSTVSTSSNLVSMETLTTPPTTPTVTPPSSVTVVINTPQVTISTPEVAISTPAVTVYAPTVSVGAKLSATSLATGLGVAIPSKAKTTVAIAKSSKKFCKVSGGKVVGIKSGPCVATVTVQAPKPKKGKKPAPVKKSVTVQIS